MDFDAYRQAYFVEPPPEPRFRFSGAFGTTLYFEDFGAAVEFYRQILGPPAYVEGEGTRGWPIGAGWLTLLKGREGNPRNVEITLEVETAAEAEALQQAFLAAGAAGPAPSDQLMYRPVRACPVTDPFGLEIMIVGPLPAGPSVTPRATSGGAQFLKLSGKWSGTSQLWLHPGASVQESRTTARLSYVAQGQFMAMAYTWEYGSEPQEGMILFRSSTDATATRAIWLDSWHMKDDIMVCDATGGGGVVSLRGSYAAPPGPDWSWRIEIEAEGVSFLLVRMFNITPLGEEALAVLARYERDPG